MRTILQASAWYPPYSVGGTEVYLAGLVAGLRARGVACRVLTPRLADAPARYEHEGVEVDTYPPIAQAGDLSAFQALLSQHPGAIYHQHSWTPDCGLAHLRLARELGLRTVLTVHVPSNLCLRGTMMLFGQTPCDGRIIEQRCAACWAQGRGAPAGLARALAAAPAGFAGLAKAAPRRIGTALSARAIARRRGEDATAMVQAADRMVAVCQWLYDALRLNGAPAQTLVLSRQGVGADMAKGVVSARAPGPLRILYLGRMHPVKGVDTLVRAVRALPDVPLELVLHAPKGGPEEETFEARLRALAAGDGRIRFGGPLPREAVPAALLAYDVMAVPSVWLETGPLVVLEAMAAGLFVLGSNLGGIAELVEGEAGHLVPPGDVAAWSRAIADLAAAPPRLAPRSVRTMDAAAEDMMQLYRSLA